MKILDSAGGSAKKAANSNQAIITLGGKPNNIAKMNIIDFLSDIRQGKSVKELYTAFGAGICDDFNINKMRYNKVIIMTDADIDGQHIRAILLTMFAKCSPELLTSGRVYVALSPLYKIEYNKTYEYFYDDNSMKKFTESLNNKNVKYTMKRYKGLGSLNHDALYETTMNPENRRLIQVKVNSYADMMDCISDYMSNDNGTIKRKELIEDGIFKKSI